MEMHNYIYVIIGLGIAFFASVTLALRWSVKSGHFKKLEQASKSIFNDEEPEGKVTDSFPVNSKNSCK